MVRPGQRQTRSRPDYVEVEVTAGASDARQVFGAHASHLNDALAPGFNVEVHLM
jgi:hypothetical protein